MSYGRVVAAALAVLAVAGCRQEADRAPDGRVDVVAAFHPLAEAATRVGGDRVRVTNLTPAGVEPHDLELTSRQVDRVEDAHVVLYVGQGFQPALAEVARRRRSGSVDVLAALEVRGDPHFWLDPTLQSRAVDIVAEALAAAAPEHADAFGAGAQGYKADLAALDRELEQGLSTCERREFVTAHDAFGHLARRYRLAQLPVAGVSPEAEPDADRLAELAALIEDKGITTVFFEELVSPDVARALARETGATTAVLNPLEGLTEEQSAAGNDYLSVMRGNLVALRAALGCQ